jgi:hypothetical protein
MSARLGLASAVSVVTAALALGGCQAPLLPSWRLTDFRVLGVKVTVPAGAPGLAQPARGEQFTLSLLTADPMTRDVQTIWLVLPHAASPTDLAGGGTSATNSGLSSGLLATLIPTCLANTPLPVPASMFQCGGGSAPTFVVPDSGGGPDASGHESLTSVAFACAGGTIVPETDSSTGELFRCQGEGARGWEFVRSVYVRSATEATPNHNPTIAAINFGLPPATLTPIAPDVPAVLPRCTDQPVQTGREMGHSSCPLYQFTVDFTADSREAYTERDPLSGASVAQTELLSVRYLVERGTLDSATRSDAEGDPMSIMDDNYLAPADPGPVRVWVVASDGRGGFDWMVRTLMVQ